ncbi:hypothetical protein [Sedimentisphaera salicampi]|uniref:Apea-like HEPN domain-containing protein n=1 Tax=Sedimentisphaera salicampi TaxID=1941349 RepID=A0A1W6LN57_9BACT|nr:hypothetical protein [Sedimentisphaera salicampi]ARN57186.1 hypothetical protein STSP1_01583 [Sedimentisphaera salicampi]
MFLVKDTIEQRDELIKSLEDLDTAVAVVIAAAHFEWTLRRCILALGTNPTKEIKDEEGALYKCCGLDGYKDAWKEEVKNQTGENLAEVVSSWEEVRKAFELRNRLVHGSGGSTGKEYGRDRIDVLLKSARELTDYAEKHGKKIYGNNIVRKEKRE